MTLLQALLLAMLQGATELFPVSSLGHAVVLPALLGWGFDQQAPVFLPFLVMLHLGTATALLLFFWRDWWSLAIGLFGLAAPHQTLQARRVLMLIAVATLPAVIIGFALEHSLRHLFGSPVIAAAFLIANGGLLLFADRLRMAAPLTTAPRSLSDLAWRDALTIGCWQCTALIPGISRSGATIAGALFRGIDHARAAHFSFLIALPIILGATVLEVPHLLHAGTPPGVLRQAALAAVLSGIVAFGSTAFLMRYFRHHEQWALRPFALYCVIAGAIGLVVLVL